MDIWKNTHEKLCLSLVTWSLRLPPVQFTRVMVASLVSAPATRAVYQSVCHIFCACPLAVGQVDFQNVGVYACRRCSSADCLSDPWSLRLPPVQFTGVFAHNVVMVQYDAAGFVGHVVLSGSHAGLSLRLFPLPSHVVCHAFVSARAALDGTGYASNSALSVVFVCQGFLRI